MRERSEQARPLEEVSPFAVSLFYFVLREGPGEKGREEREGEREGGRRKGREEERERKRKGKREGNREGERESYV